MILHDLLSRKKHDNSNPHEIISIPFNMKVYYKLGIII